VKQVICGFAVAVALAGCGGESSGTSTLEAHPNAPSRGDRRPTWISPDARKERKLLFVSDFPTASVVIFALPKLRLVGRITGFSSPQGLCADHAGNVWVADPDTRMVSEYSHSGALLNRIRDEYGSPISCAINPRTGELTVLDFAAFEGPPLRRSVPRGWAPIQVFACPVCAPTVKVVPGMDEIYFGDYDKRGDLYVDGFDTSRAVQLGTVQWGHNTGYELTLSGGKINSPAMVQWYGPGHYLIVGDTECNGKRSTCIDQVSVSGKLARITGQTNFQTAEGAPLCEMVQGVLDPRAEKTLLGGNYAACNGTSNGVYRWRYPAGGLPIRSTESGLQGPVGSALSVK
jgi:hypothetical protein